MNCPNCGRPVTEKANICPRCKTKIYHNADNDKKNNERNKNNGTQPVSLEDRQKRKKNTFLKDLGLVVVIIVVLYLLLVVLAAVGWFNIADYTKNIGWLNWFTKSINWIVGLFK